MSDGVIFYTLLHSLWISVKIASEKKGKEEEKNIKKKDIVPTSCSR